MDGFFLEFFITEFFLFFVSFIVCKFNSYSLQTQLHEQSLNSLQLTKLKPFRTLSRPSADLSKRFRTESKPSADLSQCIRTESKPSADLSEPIRTDSEPSADLSTCSADLSERMVNPVYGRVSFINCKKKNSPFNISLRPFASPLRSLRLN